MTTIRACCSLLLLAIVASAANAQDRFMPVEEGLLDTETGLVWGHDLTESSLFLTGGGFSYQWDFAMSLTMVCNDSDGEPVHCSYQDFSNWYYGREDDDWRLPTRDELVAAAEAGIIDYIDFSPEEGYQSAEDLSHWVFYWSSTTGKKKRGGFDSAWEVNLATAEAENLTVGSGGFAIPVRGVPAPVEEGPGNGNGNGKNK